MNIIRHYQKLIYFALQGNKGFYEAREYLADVLIEELEEFIDLKKKKVLDIGGERGEFCKILLDTRNCSVINLEPKKIDFVHETVIGTADSISSKNGQFDVVLLRGVLQHIPTNKKLKSLREINRVLKKNGFCYIMIPPWYNPLSGQNIKPFHYFPYKLARHLRNSVFGSNVKAETLAELGLWPMTFISTAEYINKAGFKVVKTTDILGRLHFITKIPILREIILPSVGFILKRSN